MMPRCNRSLTFDLPINELPNPWTYTYSIKVFHAKMLFI